MSIVVEGMEVKAVVDSGAQRTVIKKSLADKVCVDKKQSAILLKGIGKDLVQGASIEGVEIKVGNLVTKESLIAADIEDDILLGLDFLSKHEVAIDFGNGSMKFKEQVIQGRLAGDSGVEPISMRVKLRGKVKVPPNSVAYCVGELPEKMNSNFCFSPKYDEGIKCLMPSTYHRPGKFLPVQCVNDTDVTIVMEAGVVVGSVMEADELKGSHEHRRAEAVRVRLAEKVHKKMEDLVLPIHLVSLYENACEGLEEDQKLALKCLLIEFQDVFAASDFDLGCFTAVEHEIELENEAAPFRMKARRIPPGYAEEEEKHIEELLKAGVIKSSTSPFASAPVLVRKKDGKLRYCIDFRTLNNMTKKVCFALPLIQDMVDSLAGNKFMSSLDMNNGYYQVRVKEDHQERTAFITKYGLYEFVRMPFGLCNAPSTFQRAMNLVLRGLTWKTALAFLDDVMVLGRTFDEHLENLREVLGRFREYNLKLKPRKCTLFKRKVKFLGRLVGENTVEVDPESVEGVKDWPIPKCTKDVESFLGFVNYHREHIPRLAEIAEPLYSLTGKAPFQWDEVKQLAFEKLKETLLSPEVLAIPQNEGGFVLDCDASDSAVAAELSQYQDGVLKPVAFGSKKLSPLQRRYCTTRKELLAVVTFTRQFRHYLLSRPFLCRTDHNSLTWLTRFKDIEGQLARWLEELAQYDISIVHRRGVDHANADRLTRRGDDLDRCDCYRAGTRLEDLPCGGCKYCERMMRQWSRFEEDVDDVVPLATKVSEDVLKVRVVVPVRESNWADGLSVKEWIQKQDEDEGIKKVKSWLESGTDPTSNEWQEQSKWTKDLWRVREQLFLEDELLKYRWEDAQQEESKKLVVPRSMRDELLRLAHENVVAGHFGCEKTRQRLKMAYFWPGMSSDVELFVRSCMACERNKKGGKCKVQFEHFTSGAPMEKVHIDIVGPFPKSKQGNMYIVVMVCQFSKWCEAVAIPEQSAETVARAAVMEFFARMGSPYILYSDQGANFESDLFAEVCRLLGIAKKRTSGYRPNSNGQAERYIQTIVQMVRCTGESQDRWDEKLPLLMAAVRSTVNKSTGFTPNRLMLGREVCTPLQLMLPPESREDRSLIDFVSRLQRDMEEVHETAREKLKGVQVRQRAIRDPKRRAPEFERGDLVMVVNSATKVGQCRKLSERWLGPLIVTKVLSPILYKVTTRKKEKTVHVERMKRFVGAVPLWVRRKRRKLKEAKEESVEEVYCVCRGKDDGRPMVQCDQCWQWYHCDCMGLTREKARDMKIFECPDCVN